MDFISAIDLEMNQPSGKIIQVGASVLSLNSGVIVYKKGWLIDPGEDVTEYITNLTGISNEMIQKSAVPSEIMAEQLLEDLLFFFPPSFIADSEVPKKYQKPISVATWGCGDMELLRGIWPESVRWPFGLRYTDVKTLAWFDQLKKGNRDPKGGLGKTMKRYGMDFVGSQHRAPDDAANTLDFFYKLYTGA